MRLGAGLCFLPSGDLWGPELSIPLLLPAVSLTALCLAKPHLPGSPVTIALLQPVAMAENAVCWGRKLWSVCGFGFRLECFLEACCWILLVKFNVRNVLSITILFPIVFLIVFSNML